MRAKKVHEDYESFLNYFREDEPDLFSKIEQPDWKLSDEELEDKIKNEGEFVGYININRYRSKIMKNPRSLDTFSPAARGILTEEGDLYLIKDLNNNGFFSHDDIIKFLSDKGIISYDGDNWWEKSPRFNGFIAVQRVWNKDKFVLSESYEKDFIVGNSELSYIQRVFNNSKVKFKFYPTKYISNVM